MTGTRPYRLARRAERQAQTRQRIVGAAVDLHTTVGPATTSISAIAKHAGVERHTVYAHFPDETALFEACSSHWIDANPFPDVAAWLAIADPGERLGAEPPDQREVGQIERGLEEAGGDDRPGEAVDLAPLVPRPQQRAAAPPPSPPARRTTAFRYTLSPYYRPRSRRAPAGV